MMSELYISMNALSVLRFESRQSCTSEARISAMISHWEWFMSTVTEYSGSFSHLPISVPNALHSFHTVGPASKRGLVSVRCEAPTRNHVEQRSTPAGTNL